MGRSVRRRVQGTSSSTASYVFLKMRGASRRSPRGSPWTGANT